jgi:hypothetical protein
LLLEAAKEKSGGDAEKDAAADKDAEADKVARDKAEKDSEDGDEIAHGFFVSTVGPEASDMGVKVSEGGGARGRRGGVEDRV